MCSALQCVVVLQLLQLAFSFALQLIVGVAVCCSMLQGISWPESASDLIWHLIWGRYRSAHDLVLQTVGRSMFSRSQVSRQPRFEVPADFAPRQVWPHHSTDGPAGSGCLQIGLGCRFFLQIDSWPLPMFRPLPGFTPSQVIPLATFFPVPGSTLSQTLPPVWLSFTSDSVSSQSSTAARISLAQGGETPDSRVPQRRRAPRLAHAPGNTPSQETRTYFILSFTSGFVGRAELPVASWRAANTKSWEASST